MESAHMDIDGKGEGIGGSHKITDRLFGLAGAKD